MTRSLCQVKYIPTETVISVKQVFEVEFDAGEHLEVVAPLADLPVRETILPGHSSQVYAHPDDDVT